MKFFFGSTIHPSMSDKFTSTSFSIASKTFVMYVKRRLLKCALGVN